MRWADSGKAELDDGGVPGGAPVDLGEFGLGVGEADLESLDFAEPAFPLGLGDAGDQVVADVGQPCPLGRIRSKE
jgi:hypothetical protein